MHRQFLRLLTLCLVILFAVPALGQYTRDAAANRKIDEAINTHYLATDFDKAEAVLTGVVKACEDKCSPATLSKAWMYVGIVRGSGRNDQAGAKEAFQTALATDPSVKLDAGLATPETQTTFNNSSGGGGGGGGAAAAAAVAGGAAAAGGESSGEGITCTPSQLEVETRRHIPVQCKIDEEVTSVELRYKSFGAETWKSVKMEHKGAGFRAQIPCDATQTAGTLKLYVHGKNATGADIVNWGTKTEPIEISLVEQSTTEPPSYDDADAPPRCAAKEICPPDFPGCDSGKGGGTKDWGVQCDNSSECKSGLLCTDGTCETAPSCTSNSDCSVGTCVDGKCAVEGGDAGASGPAKKWWVGAHFAIDAAFIGGEDICMPESQATGNWACYWTGSTDKPYDPIQMQTTAVGNVGTGAALATKRVLISIDRVLTKNITGGLRLGYAFGGGPPAGKQVEWNPDDTIKSVINEGKAFLPIHAEARVAYWFGNNVFGKKGIRPYVHAGGGMAQVDAKVIVKTLDKYGDMYTADAWKKLGQGFITAGGGAVYAFTPNWGLQLNLNAMIMLGAGGFVLQPSGGLVFGL